MSVKTGHDQVAFFSLESSYGVATDPSETGALRFSEFVITPNEERISRQDRRPGSRSAEAMIRGKRNIEATLVAEDCPSGTAGTSPDLDELLQTTYDKVSFTPSTTVEASPTPTTSGCTVADAAGLATGSIIGVPALDEAGVAVVFAVRVETVVGAAITWTPELPSAPAAGATIGARVEYVLAVDNQNSATAYKYYGTDFVECLAGAVATSWEYEIEAGGVVSASATVAAKDVARFQPMALAAACTQSQTEIVVSDLTSDVYSAGRCVFQLGAEQVAVTAVDEDNTSVTIERGVNGTSAAAHDQDDEMTPVRPDPTFYGAPIAGILGRIAIGGTYYHITGARIVHRENSNLRNEQFGSATAVGKLNAAPREVSVELNGYLIANEDRWQLAHGIVQTAVLIQAGTQAGGIHAFALPKVEFDLPAIEGNADEEVPLQLTGTAMAPYGDPESELTHAYL